MKKFIAVILIILFPSLSISAELYWVDTDAYGTTIAISKEDGTRVWAEEYFPFGERFRVTEQIEANERGFINKEKDSESKLTYFEARYYSDELGRFTSVDPVGPVDPWNSSTDYTFLTNPHRLNPYAYGLNNPYKYVDPDGEFAILGALGVAWGLAEIGLSIADIVDVAKTVASDVPFSEKAAMVGLAAAGVVGPGAGYSSLTKKAYRAVSDAELEDIARHGLRHNPEIPSSMESKWFSESYEGAKQFTEKFPESKNIIEVEVPQDVYERSFKHPNIDNTGPGFAVDKEDLKDIQNLTE